MPETPAGTLWKKFVETLRAMLAPPMQHRFQDQFLASSEAALRLAESDQMVNEINSVFDRVNPGGNTPASAAVVDVVLMEMEALPRAVDVEAAEKKAGRSKSGAIERLRKGAKTILGSVKELFKLSDYGKGVIALLDEALDLAESE